jgi:hypothetical protein
VRRRDELLLRPRFGHVGADVLRHADQGVQLSLAERARFDRLQHEHTLQQAPVQDGDTHERTVRLLAGFREELEPRVSPRVGEVFRAQFFGDQPGQPFGQQHADAPDAVGAQADRGGQNQIGPIGLEEVHRTDIGSETFANDFDHPCQRGS